MSAAETAPMPKPQSALKDELPLPNAPSLDTLRPVPPQTSHPDPPKPRDKTPTPEPESEPISSTVDSKSPPHSPVEPEPEENEPPSGPLVDRDIFDQILELDDDEDIHDFSRPMVWDYFEQATKTFDTMDEAFDKKDLEQLSSLGHFLKGSSAALGLSRVQATCEKIQHHGHLRDEMANKDLSPSEAHQRMGNLLKRVKSEYREAEEWLKNFYGKDND